MSSEAFSQSTRMRCRLACYHNMNIYACKCCRRFYYCDGSARRRHGRGNLGMRKGKAFASPLLAWLYSNSPCLHITKQFARAAKAEATFGTQRTFRLHKTPPRLFARCWGRTQAACLFPRLHPRHGFRCCSLYRLRL